MLEQQRKTALFFIDLINLLWKIYEVEICPRLFGGKFDEISGSRFTMLALKKKAAAAAAAAAPAEGAATSVSGGAGSGSGGVSIIEGELFELKGAYMCLSVVLLLAQIRWMRV